MSIYSALSLQVPMIACCVLHQLKNSAERQSYLKGLSDLHSTLERESEVVAARWDEHKDEMVERTTEALGNLLGPYLQLPLQSDESDVRRIIRELLAKLVHGIDSPVRYGLSTSWEGEVIFPATENALFKRMMKAGREYLAELGFQSSKPDQSFFESLFVVEGGRNLDIIEHLIAERLGEMVNAGIDHRERLGAHTYAAYNLVFSYGAEALKLLEKKVTEAAIFFSKPHMKYEQFLPPIIEALEKMIPVLKISFITLWQRKLGLGRGREFVLRLHLRGAESETEESGRRIAEALRWLSTYKEVGFVRETLIDQGCLLVKRMVA